MYFNPARLSGQENNKNTITLEDLFDDYIPMFKLICITNETQATKKLITKHQHFFQLNQA